MIIAVDGINACGKTVFSKELAEALGCQRLKFPDFSTPSGGEIERILHTNPSHTNPMELASLMLVNRLEKLDKLKEAYAHPWNHLVVDRYVQSAVCYGVADGLSREWLESIHNVFPESDLYLWLDTPIETCQRRMRARGAANLYERSNSDRLRALWREYFELFGRTKTCGRIPTIKELRDRAAELESFGRTKTCGRITTARYRYAIYPDTINGEFRPLDNMVQEAAYYAKCLEMKLRRLE